MHGLTGRTVVQYKQNRVPRGDSRPPVACHSCRSAVPVPVTSRAGFTVPTFRHTQEQGPRARLRWLAKAGLLALDTWRWLLCA